jgi:hypothetical protein
LKKLILIIVASILAASVASAQTVTFGIASSAKTSTPNVRIAFMFGPLPTAPGASGGMMQTMRIDKIVGYYLTKAALAVNMLNPLGDGRPATQFMVQGDQDTKLYVGTDLTNYILVKSGTNLYDVPEP